MAFVMLTLGSIAKAEGQPQPQLPSIQLDVSGVPLEAELASTEIQRYMGLSFRKALAENSGMLFVYPSERPLTFTMRNTLIPLSIAFISAIPGTSDLVINEIQLMNVGPNQLFPSKQPAQFALEVNQGWFAANKIKPGDVIKRRWP